MVSLQLKIDDVSLIKIVDAYMDDVVDEIFEKSQRNIIDKGIIDEGTLLKSGQIIRNPLDKTIVYPVPWADSIEFGRLPGSMPPVEPIKGWVRRKLGIREEKEVNKVAWAIAKDIETEGLMPRPYLSPAILAVRAKIK